MAANVSMRAADDVVRVSLLSLSGRLEALWREAAEHRRDIPSRSADRERWDVAADRLTEALRSLERYAGALDPTLGRRDWASRRPASRYLPPPRVPSPG